MLTKHRLFTAQGNCCAPSPMPPNQRQLSAVRFVSISVLSVCLLVASSLMPATSLAEEQRHTVASGENLNKIVRKYYPDLDKREQRAMMKRIVEANPKGFIGGSINGLKLGVELTLPDTESDADDPKEEKEQEDEKAADSSSKNEKDEKSSDNEDNDDDVKEKAENKERQTDEKETSTEKTSAAKTESETDADKSDANKDELSDKKADDAESGEKQKDEDEKDEQENVEASEESTKSTEQADDNNETEKADKSTENAADVDKSDATDANDAAVVTQLKSQNEQLEALLEKYEAEIEILQAKSAKPDTTTDSAGTEALEAQVEQLTALAEKYEIENEALKEKLDSGSASDSDEKASGNAVVATGDDDVESLKAQVEQLTALAEKYETELDELKEQGCAANNTAENADSNANVDTDIAALKTALSEKDEKIAQLKSQVADFTEANSELSRQLAEAESNLVLKWVLGGVALFALLFGFYVISSRLRKRADEAAAEELKSVMASAEAAVEKSLDDKDPEEDNFEADIKLDIAKAYLELNNSFAAHEILQEVLREGSTSQQTKAQKLLEQIQ
jgi:pilus assembly protein FimV